MPLYSASAHWSLFTCCIYRIMQVFDVQSFVKHLSWIGNIHREIKHPKTYTQTVHKWVTCYRADSAVLPLEIDLAWHVRSEERTTHFSENVFPLSSSASLASHPHHVSSVRRPEMQAMAPSLLTAVQSLWQLPHRSGPFLPNSTAARLTHKVYIQPRFQKGLDAV